MTLDQRCAPEEDSEGAREETSRPAREFMKNMKNEQFNLTPEFQHFKEVMRGVLAMPKKRLDELVEAAKLSSPRVGDPNAPGRKRAIRERASRKPE